MNYDIILIRYGELSLKSTYVRNYFESILIKNIKKAFETENVSQNITKERGRIYLTTNDVSKSLLILGRIFGIISFSPVVQTTSDIEDMSILALQLTKDVLTKEKSFAIRATRTGTHPFTSQQVGVRIGSDIVNTTHAKVELTNPDFELFIEIRNKNSFIFTEKIRGVGGLPLGTQGTILMLLDSPSSLLAAWFLMRRGCQVIFANAKKSNEKIIRSFLTYWYADAEIIAMNPKTKNYFQKLRTIASEKNCDALVTGHTLEEPEKSLSEIAVLKKESVIPILTPLITMTSAEIHQQCKTRGIQQ